MEEAEQPDIRLVARHSLPGSTAAHALCEMCSDVLMVRVGAPLFELP
ncbi:MAG: hypothetical protein OEU91_06785 [Gammaproteobacteria bacterium]|nr:hypothetical protein [Gammaproteobacteria bacterium]